MATGRLSTDGPATQREAGRPTPWRRWRGLAAGTAVIAAMTSLVACSSGGGDSNDSSSGCAVTIGVFAPFTGASAVYGPYALDSAKLALSQFDQKSLNCKVSFKQYDTKGDAPSTVPLATAAAQDPHVVAIIGPTFSGPAESGGPIFNSAKLPMISGVASAIDLSSHGWSVFHRTVESDAVDGAGDATFIAKNLGAKTVAVVNNGQAYGAGVAEAASSGLKSAGVQIAAKVTIDPNSSDYSNAVLQIQNAKPDVVYCGCIGAEAGRLLKQLRAANVQSKYVGPAGIEISPFLEQAGPAAEGAYATAATPAEQNSPAIKKLDDQLNATYHLSSGAGYFVPQWYDAAQAYLKAIAAGKHTREDINTWLSTADFQGVSGRIKFDDKGNVAGHSESIYQVKSGKFVFTRELTAAD